MDAWLFSLMTRSLNKMYTTLEDRGEDEMDKADKVKIALLKLQQAQEVLRENVDMIANGPGNSIQCFGGSDLFFDYFKDYTIVPRNCEEFPYDAVAYIGKTKFFAVLTPEEYEKRK